MRGWRRHVVRTASLEVGGPAAAAAAALIVAHFPRTTVKYLSYIYGNPSNIFSSCLDISACLLGVPSLQAKGETVVSE